MEKTIEEVLTHQLEAIAETLNAALISLLGENADWEPTDEMPKHLLDKLKSEKLKRLTASIWSIREEANSCLHWESNHK